MRNKTCNINDETVFASNGKLNPTMNQQSHDRTILTACRGPVKNINTLVIALPRTILKEITNRGIAEFEQKQFVNR